MKPRAALLPLSSFVLALATASVAEAKAAKPVAFDVGDEHACIVTDCDRTQCWGGPNNTFGESADKAGKAVDVAVGTDHTCTLDSMGKVSCWGRPTNGLLLPDKTKTYKDIEAGQFFTCGIQTNDAISCWGWNTGHAVDGVRPATFYRQMDAGPGYACAVTSGRNAIDCWGADVPFGVRRLLAWDVLEDHDSKVGLIPERFEKVAVGNTHICWTTTKEQLYCLGENNDAGQLALGDPEDPAGTFVIYNELDGFSAHSEFDEPVNIFTNFPIIYKQQVLDYLDVSATMLGACTLYEDSNGLVYDRCWGYPFEFGWGDELSLNIVPDLLKLSGHNYCGWNKGTGEIDCVSEFPNSTLDDVEALTSC